MMWNVAEIAKMPHIQRVTVPIMTSALVFGLIPGAMSVAVAQDSPDIAPKSVENASEEDKEVASKALGTIREANDLYKEQKYSEAYAKYKEAYALYPDPAILVRLGKTAEKLEQTDEALGYYKDFVRQLPDDPAADEVREAIARLDGAETVEVGLVSDPEGAVVYLGGTEGEILGTTPSTAQLPPGEHLLLFTLSGYEDVEENVEVVAGEPHEVSVSLNEADGTPLVREFDDVASSSSRAVTEEPSHLDLYGWTVAGLGVATLVTSGIFYGIALSGEDDVNNYDKRAPGASRKELQTMKEDVETYYDVTLVTTIIGAALTAAGAGMLAYFYFYEEDQREQADTWQVGVGADSDAAWFGVNGRF